jgi:protoporphyrinogen oxidase
MRIGIVGGGLMGLVLGYRLAREGHRVTVLERDAQLGGLATHHDYGPFVWDRFYHVILPSDRHLIALISDLGLGARLHWTRTRTGFYVDGRTYSVSSALEFLRFPLVGLIGKVRLVLTMLYCARLTDWRRLEQVSAEEWLTKMCGRSTYLRLWRPLLLAKLGDSYRRVSAVFIWSYIKRLFSARDTSAKREALGYVSGGYRTVMRRLTEEIVARGGEVRTSASVHRIVPADGGGLRIDSDCGREHFDKVVCTSPTDVLARVAGRDLVHVETEGPGAVDYLGVVCGVLVTRTPLVPFYVVNIAEPRVPFTGVIGMTTVVPPSEMAGRHVTFLPKYVLSTDPPFLRAPDQEVRAAFMAGLRLMFPDRDWSDVEALHVNRAFKVQPLQVRGYSQLVPTVETRHPDFYVLNTSQFVNSTHNNTEGVRAVGDFLGDHGAAFAAAAALAPAARVQPRAAALMVSHR